MCRSIFFSLLFSIHWTNFFFFFDLKDVYIHSKKMLFVKMCNASAWSVRGHCLHIVVCKCTCVLDFCIQFRIFIWERQRESSIYHFDFVLVFICLHNAISVFKFVLFFLFFSYSFCICWCSSLFLPHDYNNAIKMQNEQRQKEHTHRVKKKSYQNTWV